MTKIYQASIRTHNYRSDKVGYSPVPDLPGSEMIFDKGGFEGYMNKDAGKIFVKVACGGANTIEFTIENLEKLLNDLKKDK